MGHLASNEKHNDMKHAFHVKSRSNDSDVSTNDENISNKLISIFYGPIFIHVLTEEF